MMKQKRLLIALVAVLSLPVPALLRAQPQNAANDQGKAQAQTPAERPDTAQPQNNQPTGPTSEEFTLNLKDADITTLIATVSEITGRNFVVDPRVKGQVTVLSAESMSPDDLYQTFLSVLEVHGFSAVPAGEVTKIVPQVNAKQDGGFGRATDTNEDIITRVLQVDNVPADQLVPILRPLVPQYGHLAAYPASNILIISDRAANVERIADIVSQVDKQGNSKVERIPLDNASASEVVRVIDQLKSDASQRSPATAAYNAIADQRTNSVLITGDPASRTRLRAIIADLDTPSKQQGGTQVFYLNYADAESVAPALQSFAKNAGKSQEGKSAASGGGDVSVIAEKGANALVVTAPADVMREIGSVIEKLDIRRGQVLVQAIIAEVSVNKSRQLGVDLAFFNKNGPAAATILDQNTLNSLGSLGSDAGSALGLIEQGANVAAGKINKGGNSFALLLKALSGDSNTNVLSTPSLLTRDNEEAKITVAQEVPFITGQFTSGGLSQGGGQQGVVNPFQTVERKEVGLILGITPQINAGDTIQLTIKQEVSSIAQGTSGAVDLVTNKRTIDTSVEVETGQILVLGGLIDDNVQESEQRVPILSDIPLLGELFKSRNVQKQKRNLLNFIRPTILRGQGQANYYTRQKYNYMRRLQKQHRESSIPLLPGEQRPLAPPMEEYEQTPDFSGDARIRRPSEQETTEQASKPGSASSAGGGDTDQ